MAAPFFPLQYLIAVLALWISCQQQAAIDYLKEENRLLKAKLGTRRLHFSDAERIRLATRAKAVCRKLLGELETLVTTNPNEAWMLQMARNALDCDEGHLVHGNTLIVDRDTKYCAGFRELLMRSGIEVIRLPPRSPKLNAYAERFVGSIKHECLNRLIFIGEASLRRALREYTAHFHRERNHQGLDNALIAANDADFAAEGTLQRRGRLGGMLNFYHRQVA